MFRERDRTLNQSVYPGLYFPEIYLLHKGYKVRGGLTCKPLFTRHRSFIL